METAPVEMDIHDEPDRILLAAKGDEDAFATLFRDYYPMIFAYSYKLSLNTASAEDIAQLTFVKAAQNLARFSSNTSFKSWLFAIAANCFRDSYRKQKREAELHAEFVAVPRDSAPEYDEVHAALQRLSPAQREVVVLVYLENLSHREAAILLGCAETTVSWRLCLARRHLKKLLSSQA